MGLFVHFFLWIALMAQMKDNSSSMNKHSIIKYQFREVKGLRIFYREAGSPKAPTILLLHGFPSSSRMFQSLIPLLADHYHLIAPDYPGFGFSDTPDAHTFRYNFKELSLFMDAFLDSLHISSYHLYLQDYGGPIGFRLALWHPEKIKSLIIQNAVIHEEGLSPLWDLRKSYWKDHITGEQTLRESLHSIEVAQNRHLSGISHPELINPDEWRSEYDFLQRPGEEQIQLDLMYDYKSNVDSYVVWQDWLHTHQPPLLVVWGKHDPLFTQQGALLYKKEVPKAEIHFLEAGHFALDLASEEIAHYIKIFLVDKN